MCTPHTAGLFSNASSGCSDGSIWVIFRWWSLDDGGLEMMVLMLVLCACSYAWWLFIISSCHLVILKWLYLPVSMGNPDWSRRSVRDQSDASSWRGFAFRRALGSRTYRRCLYLYHSTSFYIILIHSTCISIFYICILYLYSKFYLRAAALPPTPETRQKSYSSNRGWLE